MAASPISAFDLHFEGDRRFHATPQIHPAISTTDRCRIRWNDGETTG
jgi:hypothetical protein